MKNEKTFGSEKIQFAERKPDFAEMSGAGWSFQGSCAKHRLQWFLQYIEEESGRTEQFQVWTGRSKASVWTKRNP